MPNMCCIVEVVSAQLWPPTPFAKWAMPERFLWMAGGGNIPLLPVPEAPPLPAWNEEQEATAAMSGNATHQLMDRLASMLATQDDDGRAAAVALWTKASELCMSKMQSKMAMAYQGKADEHA